MHILGIESSADDTGIALIETTGTSTQFSFKIRGNVISSQTEVHAQYGGIFPAMAKREHAKNLVPVLEMALREASVLHEARTPVAGTAFVPLKEMLAREPELLHAFMQFALRYEKPKVDCIAVTTGPGLEPCLWTGINLAKALSVVWDIPVVATNHMEGHIMISAMEFSNSVEGNLPHLEFPALALLVSGGHTELILVKKFGEYEYIGRTRDDAVGEAFDKVARTLGLPYPGGPEISRLAEYARNEDLRADFKLPRPMMHEDTYDFSFSGLKTAVERHVAEHPLESLDRERIAREFEDTATEVLVYKTLRAVEEYGAHTVIMGGGVSANKHIRSELKRKLESVGSELRVCPPKFSTDNGLMIAIAGSLHALKGEHTSHDQLVANGSLKLPA